MPTPESDAVRISAGPRWDALIEALDLAVQHLEPPLTSAELGRGWCDDMRMLILASVNQIKSDIDKTHRVQPDHYKSWIKSEMIDPRVEDSRWSFALGPDGAVTDIEDAEELLNSAISLGRDLPSLGASLPGKGFEEQMVASLHQTAAVLASGRYITMVQFQVWDEILTRCGVRRRVLPTSISTERVHPGVNIDFIEERPRGHAWDRIDNYDHLFVNHGEWDILHHASSD